MSVSVFECVFVLIFKYTFDCTEHIIHIQTKDKQNNPNLELNWKIAESNAESNSKKHRKHLTESLFCNIPVIDYFNIINSQTQQGLENIIKHCYVIGYIYINICIL